MDLVTVDHLCLHQKRIRVSFVTANLLILEQFGWRNGNSTDFVPEPQQWRGTDRDFTLKLPIHFAVLEFRAMPLQLE